MIGHILLQNQVDCSYLIGGVMAGQNTGFRWSSSSRVFVLEGDEYDTAFFDKTSKFLKFMPDILVINAVEFDHGDIFEDLEAIRRSFRHLLRRTPGDARIIANTDDPEVAALVGASYSQWREIGNGQKSNRLACIDAMKANAGLVTIQATYGKTLLKWSWCLPGLHNARNGLAAICAACELGVDPDLAADALSHFPGVKRRFQLRHVDQLRNIHVFEDFAHHPTSIRETIAGTRKLFADRRIVAWVEPATNTMRSGILAEDLTDALGSADFSVLLPVPPDRRHAISTSGAHGGLARTGESVVCLAALDDFEELLARVAEEGDVWLFMSNGTFQGTLDRAICYLKDGN